MPSAEEVWGRLFRSPNRESLTEQIPHRFFEVEEVYRRRGGGRVGPEVGVPRQDAVLDLFKKIYATDLHSHSPTDPLVATVLGRPLSMKTKQGGGFSGVKLKWTVDPKKAGDSVTHYRPQSDLLYINIIWGKWGGLFLIPITAQEEVLRELGREQYLKPPKPGKNPRGVELTSAALRGLQGHPRTWRLDLLWPPLPAKRERSRTSSFGTVTRAGHDSSPFYGRRLYADLSAAQDGTASAANAPPPKAYRETTPQQTDVIHCRDSRSMKELPAASVHLMITSPPYNVGKDYDNDLSLEDYGALLEQVLQETHRVLVWGGRACINIANVGRTPYLPLHTGLIAMAHACGFKMRGEIIIWNKAASAGTSCAWGSWRSASNPVLRDVHEYILVFSKGSFKRAYPGESSILREQFLEYTKSVWEFPAERARRVKHPAPFPLELPRRLIQLYSYVGDIVLDPFLGSGTTAVAALNAQRRYIGYETNPEYVRLAEERLQGDSKRG